MDRHLVSRQFQFKVPLLSGELHIGRGTLARSSLLVCTDDAAHAAADCWLRVFEERLEGSSELPELTRITAAAIALFVSRLVLLVVGVEKLSTSQPILMRSVWQWELFSSIV
jgi:hypothetical protein